MPSGTPPIAFIVCSPRSGSTLLGRILDSHSLVASPFELGMPSIFWGKPKEEEVLYKLLTICRHYDIDFHRCLKDENYLITSLLEKENKQYLVIKDPSQSHFMHRIHANYGDIPIIHLVRDVRDVCQSVMWEGQYKRGMRFWADHNQKILDSKFLFSRYMLVRYEDLTANTVHEVTRILEFLGYEYEPGMEEYWRFQHTDDDISLWAGMKPEASPWHQTLQSKKIQKKANARPWLVNAIYKYKWAGKIMQLNQYFGYH